MLIPEIINPAYSIWKYTDHKLKNEYVCVSVNNPTGSKSVSFDVSDDGMKLIIRFIWAPAMHDPLKMFNESIAANDITIDHSMLHAMASASLNSGITADSNPETQWVIPLLNRVRREVSSYSMTKLTYETTTMVFIKLTAFQNDVFIEHANRRMTLE